MRPNSNHYTHARALVHTYTHNVIYLYGMSACVCVCTLLVL